MRTALFAILLCGWASAHAYISGIAIQTERKAPVLVIVNGNPCNAQPESFVHVKSLVGLYHLEVRVYSPYDRSWHVLRRDVVAEKGYDYYFSVVFDKQDRPVLTEARRYPVYTKFYVNPSLYNRHPIS